MVSPADRCIVKATPLLTTEALARLGRGYPCDVTHETRMHPKRITREGVRVYYNVYTITWTYPDGTTRCERYMGRDHLPDGQIVQVV